jgi:hypothetical protein
MNWIEARGGVAEAKRAMIYSRESGGGGVVCFVDDGRPWDQEVDLAGLRGVEGYYALPKWYLVPDGVGSARIRAGWYGQRIGRPEHYYVTPATALGRAAPAGSGPHSDLPVTEEGRALAAEAASRVPKDIRRILARSGNRVHRSRVVPWPYCDEMDLQQARWFPMWNGWGPGAIEACLAPFLARRSGALRLAAIMNSVVVNTVTMTDLGHRQSTPDYGALVRARLEFIKACRDFMSDSLPIIATDNQNKFDSLTHQVSGIDKLVAAQRQYLLDVLEYPAVVLFGDSVGGMNGGDRAGEWRSYDARVQAFRSSWVWTAGSFGGGLRQMVLMAMGCKRGPTDGRMDPTVKPTWTSILNATDDEKATTRLKNAQARAQDRLATEINSAALRRYDPTFQEAYPGLDVDEGPLPTIAAATPGNAAPAGTTSALDPTAGGATAVTPAAANEALAGDVEAEAPAADATPTQPVALPTDIRTERECAAALGLTTRAFRKWVEEHGVTTYPMPGGTRGGHRMSLGEVLKAWQASAVRRADAAAKNE